MVSSQNPWNRDLAAFDVYAYAFRPLGLEVRYQIQMLSQMGIWRCNADRARCSTRTWQRVKAPTKPGKNNGHHHHHQAQHPKEAAALGHGAIGPAGLPSAQADDVVLPACHVNM